MATKKKLVPRRQPAKAKKVIAKKPVASKVMPAAKKAAKPASIKKPTPARRKPAAPAKVTRASARAFVIAARLPAAPRRPQRRDLATIPEFAEMTPQAAVVGSGVLSFTAGVPAQRREDLCNATLLAQLAANRKVPDRTNIMPWFDAYFGALMQLGWSVQQSGFREYAGQLDGLETHQAVRNVAAALLGPSPAALAVVLSTLDAMQSMDRDSPWITIFDREHRDSKSTHSQIGLADQLPNGGLMMHLMAFSLEANSKLTQVLFFKLRKKKVRLQQNSGQAIVDVGVLASVRAALKKRLADHVTDFIATVEI